MKIKTSIVLVLPSLTLLAAALHAAEVAPAAPTAAAETAQSASPAAPADPAAAGTETPEATDPTTVTAVVTPRLFCFHTFEGWCGDRANFLERYDYREGFADDNRSDVFADLDLDVTVNNG